MSNEEAKRSVWMVYRQSAFGDYRTPVNTYGPFESKEAAERFAEGGGTVYDHAALTLGDREILGIWD